ncbi:MAG TPA: PIG-L deacetylase family protein [Anaerolineae bacterium]|nr:PIG-L deacetylase family protein [Anaerolineae bacterium]
MRSKGLTLMAFFAHPDDEAFGTGGTLAKYAAEGCDVYLVTATRGEAGEIVVPDLTTPADLPFVRERELRCACEIYGIHPPRFLDYPDGLLPIIHQGQAVGKLVRLIRELKPQVLVTFGPDGIYGHYDHIAVHRWATIAYDLAADPQCFAGQLENGCAPHQVSKLYYRVLSEERLAAMSEDEGPAAVMMDGVPFALVGRPRDEITTVIDVGDFAEVKLRGLQCHVSQVGYGAPFGETPEEVLKEPWFRQETFTLARSTVRTATKLETDLFSGLR